LGGLLGLRGITLGTLIGSDYEGFGLVLDNFEVSDVAVELAGVLSDELIAFSDLLLVRWCSKTGWCELTCSLGSGFQNSAFIDSMMAVLKGQVLQ
jgi:hypothetical protein